MAHLLLLLRVMKVLERMRKMF